MTDSGIISEAHLYAHSPCSGAILKCSSYFYIFYNTSLASRAHNNIKNTHSLIPPEDVSGTHTFSCKWRLGCVKVTLPVLTL